MPSTHREVPAHWAELLLLRAQSTELGQAPLPAPLGCRCSGNRILQQQRNNRRKLWAVGGGRFPEGCGKGGGKRGRILVRVSEKIFAPLQNGARGSCKALPLCCSVRLEQLPSLSAFCKRWADGMRCQVLDSVDILLERCAWGSEWLQLVTWEEASHLLCAGPAAKLSAPWGATASTQPSPPLGSLDTIALWFGGSCLKIRIRKLLVAGLLSREGGVCDHLLTGEKVLKRKKAQPHTPPHISTTAFVLLIPLSKLVKVRTCYEISLNFTLTKNKLFLVLNVTSSLSFDLKLLLLFHWQQNMSTL